jgi:hypothetical protein
MAYQFANSTTHLVPSHQRENGSSIYCKRRTKLIFPSEPAERHRSPRLVIIHARQLLPASSCLIFISIVVASTLHLRTPATRKLCLCFHCSVAALYSQLQASKRLRLCFDCSPFLSLISQYGVELQASKRLRLCFDCSPFRSLTRLRLCLNGHLPRLGNSTYCIIDNRPSRCGFASPMFLTRLLVRDFAYTMIAIF